MGWNDAICDNGIGLLVANETGLAIGETENWQEGMMIVDIELIDFTSIIGCFWEMGDGKWTGAINMERTDADIKIVKKQGFILFLDLSFPQIQTLTNQ